MDALLIITLKTTIHIKAKDYYQKVMVTIKLTQCVVTFVLEMWAQDDNWGENIVMAKSHFNK
ncbi:hypothetical protein [Photobacterium leiognathi]|uniref:hypothetical protein n=1 Tax=Photobacterium leiognathi TaxID=553611 RepID=UPI002738D968|nr:hypothetical protein [Photobacterium leiognathi]